MSAKIEPLKEHQEVYNLKSTPRLSIDCGKKSRYIRKLDQTLLMEFFLDAVRDVVDFFSFSFNLERLRRLTTPVANDNGLSMPCSFLKSPQPLHRGLPASSRRQRGVFEVWQLVQVSGVSL